MGPYIYHKVKSSRDSLLCDLIIGRHLIPLFPEMTYIQKVTVMSRDDLVHYLMIGQHLIPLFPQTAYIAKAVLMSRDDLVCDLMIGQHLIPLFLALHIVILIRENFKCYRTYIGVFTLNTVLYSLHSYMHN